MKKQEKIERNDRQMMYIGIFYGSVITLLLIGGILVFKLDLKGILYMLMQTSILFVFGYNLGRLKTLVSYYRAGYKEGRKRGKQETTNILQMHVENKYDAPISERITQSRDYSYVVK